MAEEQPEHFVATSSVCWDDQRPTTSTMMDVSEAAMTIVTQWTWLVMVAAGFKFCGVNVLAVIRSLSTASGLRKSITQSGKPRHWIDILWGTLIYRHGGSFITAIVITHKCPGWLVNPASLYGLFIAYWLICCIPTDIVYRVWNNYPGFYLFNVITNSISKIHCVSTWGADSVLNSPIPALAASPSAALAAGVIVGCGGGVLGHFLHVSDAGRIQWPPAEVSNNSYSTVQSSLLFTVLYLLATDPLKLVSDQPFMTAPSTIALLVVVDVVITLAQDASGVNPYVEVSSFIRKFLLIPDQLSYENGEKVVGASGAQPQQLFTGNSIDTMLKGTAGGDDDKSSASSMSPDEDDEYASDVSTPFARANRSPASVTYRSRSRTPRRRRRRKAKLWK